MLVRRTLALLLAAGALLAVAVTAAHPSPAAAAGPCAGKKIFEDYAKSTGWDVRLQVFYDARTKRNCALMRHFGKARKKKMYTQVGLGRCMAGDVEGGVCHRESGLAAYRQDQGRFTQYAGPVRIKAGGRCIYAWGAVVAPDSVPSGAAVGTSTGANDLGYIAKFCG
jgi:hypothetical protein